MSVTLMKKNRNSIALLRFFDTPMTPARSSVCVCVQEFPVSHAHASLEFLKLCLIPRKEQKRERESLLDIEVIRPLRSVLVWGAIKLCAGVTHDGF